VKIGIVIQYSYPLDKEIRTRKMARAFSQKNNEVFLLCPNDGQQVAVENIEREGKVYRFGRFGRGTTLSKITSSPVPLNGLWTPWIVRVAKRNALDVLVIRNLRLAPQALIAAKHLRLPTILDLPENFPAITEIYGKQAWHHHVTRNRRFISILERVCISFANHLWVVCEENRNRLITLGVLPAKISVVRNTPELNGVADASQLPRHLPRPVADRFQMVYWGIVTRFRGLELVLRAMPYILAETQGIKFVILGDGLDRPRLQALARSLDVQHNVHFAGWVSPEEGVNALRHYDLGLIPHEINEWAETTIPNKLFDYMQAGLPVLSTDTKPIRRIVEETGCGVVTPQDPEKFARAVLRLKASPSRCSQMGQFGREAVLRKYNWAIDAHKALEILDQLASTRRA